MDNYKPFSSQLKECSDNGNLISVELLENYQFDNHVLVCCKYKKQCSSNVCLQERTSEEPITTNPDNVK